MYSIYMVACQTNQNCSVTILSIAGGNASICRFSDCVCVLRNLLVNALVIVNVWAFQSGFLFLLWFYCKCMRFCVDVSLLKVNVWRFLCACQSKFSRFGCWFNALLILNIIWAFLFFCSFRGTVIMYILVFC